MGSGSIESGGDEYLNSTFEQEVNLIQNGGVTFHQTLSGLHALANHLSKWIVAVTYSIFILLRHDAFALWAALGSVLNIILSVVLKKILKQERPVSGVSSGHGMPSSHAQSIFFAIVFVTLSVVQWQGLNGVTAIFGMLLLALGSYFSWLRVSQRYHTTSQVVVGAVVGSIFSVIWFWAWEASVHKAYNSSLWVRIPLVVGTAFFCLGFVQHVIRDWIKDIINV
nr:lipid phosphate phosphatase epsilon 2, chloroplastic [Tanacetum cinerariifolium]